MWHGLPAPEREKTSVHGDPGCPCQWWERPWAEAPATGRYREPARMASASRRIRLRSSSGSRTWAWLPQLRIQR